MKRKSERELVRDSVRRQLPPTRLYLVLGGRMDRRARHRRRRITREVAGLLRAPATPATARRIRAALGRYAVLLVTLHGDTCRAARQYLALAGKVKAAR